MSEESPWICEETLLPQETKMERDTLELKRRISHLAYGHHSLGLFRLQDYREKLVISFPSLLHAQPCHLNRLWRSYFRNLLANKNSIKMQSTKGVLLGVGGCFVFQNGFILEYCIHINSLSPSSFLYRKPLQLPPSHGPLAGPALPLTVPNSLVTLSGSSEFPPSQS